MGTLSAWNGRFSQVGPELSRVFIVQRRYPRRFGYGIAHGAVYVTRRITDRRNRYAFTPVNDAETGTPDVYIAGLATARRLRIPAAAAETGTVCFGTYLQRGPGSLRWLSVYARKHRQLMQCVRAGNLSLTQKRVRHREFHAARGSQKWVRAGAAACPVGLFAESGTPQKQVRTMRGRGTSHSAQNWVRFRPDWSQKQVRSTPASGVGAVRSVPDSAWIRPSAASARHVGTASWPARRRNGYACSAADCGKACGISRLSPQIPVRRLR